MEQQEQSIDYKQLLLQAGFLLVGTEENDLLRSAHNKHMQASACVFNSGWCACTGDKTVIASSSCEALYKVLDAKYNISAMASVQDLTI